MDKRDFDNLVESVRQAKDGEVRVAAVLQVPLIEANPDVPLPIPTQYWLLNVQQPWAYLLVPPNLHLQVTAFGGGAYFLEAYEPEVGPQGQKGAGLMQGGE